MPYFNCRETIRDAVESILNQSYKDFTLLVINDGDNSSREILADITDPRLKIYDLPVNRGRYFADAVSLEANPYKFFLPTDADDVSDLHRVLRLMRRAEGFSAVFHHQKVLWRNGSITLERTPLLMRTLGPNMRHLAHWSGIYKTKALKEIGGIHADFRVGYDTLIVNLLRMAGKVSIITEFLYTRRVRDNSLTVAEATNYKSPHRAKARIELQRLYALCLESPTRIREIITKSIKPETLKNVKIEAQKLRKIL